MDSATIIGIIAGVLTTACFVPQLIKAWKTKSTKDISIVMYIAFVIGVALWVIYGVYKNALPIILANSVTLAIAIAILIFKIKYN
jgi:MtN3 and saliva related transmembrane protein